MRPCSVLTTALRTGSGCDCRLSAYVSWLSGEGALRTHACLKYVVSIRQPSSVLRAGSASALEGSVSTASLPACLHWSPVFLEVNVFSNDHELNVVVIASGLRKAKIHASEYAGSTFLSMLCVLQMLALGGPYRAHCLCHPCRGAGQARCRLLPWACSLNGEPKRGPWAGLTSSVVLCQARRTSIITQARLKTDPRQTAGKSEKLSSARPLSHDTPVRVPLHAAHREFLNN